MAFSNKSAFMQLSTRPREMLFQMLIWENKEAEKDADDVPTKADDVPTKAEIAEIVETMIEDGHNAREIVAEVPLSRTTIWRRLQRYAARQLRYQKEQEEKKMKRQ